MVPFNRPHMIWYQSPIATMSLFCSVSEISVIPQNLMRSHDHEHIPFWVIYCACTSTPWHQSAYQIQNP